MRYKQTNCIRKGLAFNLNKITTLYIMRSIYKYVNMQGYATHLFNTNHMMPVFS